MTSFNPINTLISFFSLSILLFLVACQDKHIANQGRSRTEAEIAQLLDKVPPNQPDTYIKTIQDSAANEWEIQKMCYYVLNGGWRQSPDDYKKVATKIDSLFGKSNDTIHLYVLGYSGQNFFRMGQQDTGFSVMKTCLELAEQYKDSALLCFAYQNMGDAYMMKSKNEQSIEMLYKALDFMPRSWVQSVPDLMVRLANNYTRQHNFVQAKVSMYKGFSLTEQYKDSARMYLYATQLASTYADMEQGDSTLWAAQKAYTIAQKLKDSSHIATIYYYLAAGYRIKKDYTQSLNYAQQALTLCNPQDWVLLHQIKRNIADSYWLMGDLDKAKTLYNEIVEEDKKKMGKRVNLAICDSLVVLNLTRMGEKELASNFRRVRASIDSTFSAERVSIREDMHVRYETAEKENKIKTLALEKRGLQVQALVITLVLLIGGFIAVWIIYRNRQKNLLLLNQNALLKANQQLHLQELAANQQQLSDFKAHILDKNKVIQEMQVKLDDRMKNADTISEEEYEKNKSALSDLKILTERDWKTYLEHFENVYPDVITKVKEKYPSLSQGELRLIILQYMDFNRKEIVDILGISSESVRKNQYRLRKKLGLGEGEDLADFIQELKK